MTAQMPRMLSKSQVLASRQCQRRLWLEINHPELRDLDNAMLQRLREGRRLEAVAHDLYPGGVLIDRDTPVHEALQETAIHLQRTPRTPLFEATFSAHQVLVHADVIAQTHGGRILTEIKSSTRVKPYHLIDCAIQHWVIDAAGHPVNRVLLAHIDRRFNYRGNDDYAGLLHHADVTEPVTTLLPQVPRWVEAGLDTLGNSTEPAIGVGPHCTHPLACPFRRHCEPHGSEYPLRLLPDSGRIITQLRAEGIDDIRDIPDGRLHKPLHLRVRAATITGEPFVGPAIGDALQALPYPRYYLDFETIQSAVPRWPYTHPYEQLPFQWSCHIEPVAGVLEHAQFLDTSGESPLWACAQSLLDALGTAGPVFTYSPFEKTVIRRLAARFPDLAPRMHSLAERLYDLLPLVRAHYYHPAMKGSYSIKAVLPTIATDLSYEALGEVHDGVGAQIAYEELIEPSTCMRRKASLVDALRRYCALDTLAMVRIVRFFAPTVSAPG